MELLIMNSGERLACRTPDGDRLRHLTLFAKGGFGDVTAIFPQFAGGNVAGEIIGTAVFFRVEADTHTVATVYVASDMTMEAEVWEIAESAYLSDSDKYAGEMHAEAYPQKPETLPWAAMTLWPLLYRQESPNAIINVQEVAAAVALGALNAMAQSEGGNIQV